MASKKPEPPKSPVAVEQDDAVLTDAQRAQITQLFMKRVRDPKMRRMIVRYSTFLAESRDNDTFYSSLYTFSLSENFDKLRQSYEDFAVDAIDLSEFDEDAAEGVKKLVDESMTARPKKKPTRKKKK